jgi:hypothetical protein
MPDDTQRSSERRALAWLFTTCGLLIAGGLIVGGDRRPPVAVDLADVVPDAQIVEIRDDRGVTVLSGEFRSRRDALGNMELDAALMNRRARQVIGEVEVEIPAAGREDRQPELEVDVLGLAPNASYTVVIDDRAVGRFTTDDRGSIDMELREGEPPPTLQDRR